MASTSSNSNETPAPDTTENQTQANPSALTTMQSMEDELLCSICSELFIKAVTLNCAHSFCKYCITQWQKHKSFCPICRTKISGMAQTLVLDNYIAKVLEKQTQEVKDRRKDLMAQRELDHSNAENASIPNLNNYQNNNMGPDTSTDEDDFFEDDDDVYDDWDYHSDNYDSDYSNYEGDMGEYDEIEHEEDEHHNDDEEEEAEEEENEEEEDCEEEENSANATDNTADNTDNTDNNTQSETDHSDQEMSDGYNGIEGGFWGGYGKCWKCREFGHWSNGCPNR